MSETDNRNIRVLCENIGTALVACQTAEKLINLSLLVLFPKEPIRTVEMFDHLDEKQRRKNLGYFIRALRERVGIDQQFDGLLGDFLEHRNILAHDLTRVPGHSFFTPVGLERINGYVLRLVNEAQRVTEIFTAFIDSWTDRMGMSERLRQQHPDIYDSDFITNIRASITPLLDALIYEKPK
jgi:hypothetical protein